MCTIAHFRTCLLNQLQRNLFHDEFRLRCDSTEITIFHYQQPTKSILE